MKSFVFFFFFSIGLEHPAVFYSKPHALAPSDDQDVYAPVPTPGWRQNHMLVHTRVSGDVYCILRMAEMDFRHQW